MSDGITPMAVPEPAAEGYTRREALVMGLFALAAAATATGCSAADKLAYDEFVQKHFKDLTPEELKDRLAQMEKRYTEQYGKEVKVSATPALPGVLFGYALDLSRCIGCRRCVYGCVDENNQSRDPQTHWITVLEMDKETGVDLQHADAFYDHKTVPAPGKFYELALVKLFGACTYRRVRQASPLGRHGSISIERLRSRIGSTPPSHHWKRPYGSRG